MLDVTFYATGPWSYDTGKYWFIERDNESGKLHSSSHFASCQNNVKMKISTGLGDGEKNKK